MGRQVFIYLSSHIGLLIILEEIEELLGCNHHAASEGAGMKRFKKIAVLAGLAGIEDPALQRAAALAKLNNATVEIIDFVETLTPIERAVIPAQWNLPQLLLQERQEYVNKLASHLHGRGIDSTTHVLSGRPAEEIARFVQLGRCDLLLKTARPEGTMKKLRLGTLAKRLMRICPCPVWIIQPDQPNRFERILVAINPEEDSESFDLNRKLVEIATSLAEQEGAELHVIHAWSAHADLLLRRRFSEASMRQYIQDCQEAASRKLKRFFTSIGGMSPSCELQLLQGEPQEVIVGLVEERRVDLVVMGTVSRSGVAGYLIGNTAESILRQIETSVLTVKPEGF